MPQFCGYRVHTRVSLGPGRDAWREVIGVLKSTRDGALDESAGPTIYIPMEQDAPFTPQFLAGQCHAFSGRLRAVVTRADPRQGLPVTSMDSLQRNSASERRFSVMTLGAFGLLAPLLAAVGIYKVVSYWVQEIGVRMALGAQTGNVARMVLTQGLRVTAIGIGLGVAGAFVLTRGMASLLYGVTAAAPAIFTGVPAFLAAVELAACYLPARRASRVDPVDAHAI